MANPTWSQGEVLLADLDFSDSRAGKRRPVLVVYDFGDEDLLVVPVTSHPARCSGDVTVRHWADAGLKLPSTIRLEKFATITKSSVLPRLGTLAPGDLAAFRMTLATICQRLCNQGERTVQPQ
mgnify:CR=1 FL=1